MSHTVDIRRASGSLGGWIAMCQDCGWCPDVVHRTSQAAFTAAGRHTLEAENRPTETTD